MGYIIHTSDEFKKLSDIEQERVINLALAVFAIAVQTDRKPKVLIVKPGKCEPEFMADNDVMFSCIDISKPVASNYLWDPDGAVHIFIRLLSEVNFIFL